MNKSTDGLRECLKNGEHVWGFNSNITEGNNSPSRTAANSPLSPRRQGEFDLWPSQHKPQAQKKSICMFDIYATLRGRVKAVLEGTWQPVTFTCR